MIVNDEENFLNTTDPAPLRLYLLQLALAEDGTPIPGYLIQMSDGTNILVDTGVPLDGSFPPAGGRRLQIFSIIEQLAALGVTPADVDLVVCTHFDPDHCGNHDAFPGSEFVVQRTHYAFARATDLPRFTMMRARWDQPALRYRFVSGDVELVPGVKLIETSGHVPGHQAVLVCLPETGPVLLAIDAAAMAADLDPATRPYENGTDLDPAQAQESARKLFALVQQQGVRLVVFGHDEQRWPAINKAR
jgi:N-acyl homoserine lactone hydrolase